MEGNEIKTVTVIGAGDMGHGIAECALLAGYPVRLYDVKQEFVDRGVVGIVLSLDKFRSKGTITSDLHARITNTLLKPTIDFKTAVQDADLVIEAVPEKPEIKKDVFKKAEQFGRPGAILASNTSSIPISLMAEGLRKPEQLLGLHFFNPVVLMKLAEVIKGEKTSDIEKILGYKYSEEIIHRDNLALL